MNFDQFINLLIKHYQLPAEQQKHFDNEMYRFVINGSIPVTVYADAHSLIYLHAELGQYHGRYEGICKDLLTHNAFSLKNPLITLGIDSDDKFIAHTRCSLNEIQEAEAKDYFEHFIDRSAILKHHYQL